VDEGNNFYYVPTFPTESQANFPELLSLSVLAHIVKVLLFNQFKQSYDPLFFFDHTCMLYINTLPLKIFTKPL
jgi:hypothetical protein